MVYLLYGHQRKEFSKNEGNDNINIFCVFSFSVSPNIQGILCLFVTLIRRLPSPIIEKLWRYRSLQDARLSRTEMRGVSQWWTTGGSEIRTGNSNILHITQQIHSNCLPPPFTQEKQQLLLSNSTSATLSE